MPATQAMSEVSGAYKTRRGMGVPPMMHRHDACAHLA